MINKKQKHIGLFSSAKDAHEAYKKEALKLHGIFSNFG